MHRVFLAAKALRSTVSQYIEVAGRDSMPGEGVGPDCTTLHNITISSQSPTYCGAQYLFNP
jgi:hypothetical protein